MDLLGSIMGSMTGPPKVSEEERKRRKKAKEAAEKAEEASRAMSKQFRTKTEAKVNEFIKDSARTKLTCPPMEKHLRSIVHDVAEIAGLVAHSFGSDDDGQRHVVLWKKEAQPSEDEIECLKRGEEWDPEKFAKTKEEREAKEKQEAEEARLRKKEKFVPSKGNYQQKYEHLIGKDSALEAAKKTELNKNYGMVSAESKRDRRTVEDIQKEIREKKRQKLENEEDDS